MDLAEAPKMRKNQRGQRRVTDKELVWVQNTYPQLSSWRVLAKEWLAGENEALHTRLSSLVVFLEKYLINLGLPLEPADLLRRGENFPEFYASVCPESNAGIAYNNTVSRFLDWVLIRDYSEAADDGHPVVSPAFRNPVPRMSRRGMPRLDESVHSPLPYGYIDELRQLLAAGPSFSDWTWAHTAGGHREIKGNTAPDWFPVSESQIDKSDPDCVWRLRSRTHGPAILEMWSPVRWVALLIKLILPLRTMQVRLLDSGEADTWRYVAGKWTLNLRAIAEGSDKRPWKNGVFRRSDPQGKGFDGASLYINTNKTADRYVAGPVKGYVMPWPETGHIHQQAFYWLEKLRDWQEEYNPIQRRTPWTNLDGRHIQAKSEIQLAGYPDACFLFRLPETTNPHLPVHDAVMNRCWFHLLRYLEVRMEQRGETHSDGSKIRLLPSLEVGDKSIRTLFPLHSLRVSLITALALDGSVPFPILQKLVGHSRLLMTLYYTKPGAAFIREKLTAAASQLEENKERSIQHFLLNTAHEDLIASAISNCKESFSAAIPFHITERNPAGWMPMHHGICLVGGNTCEVEGYPLGGCHNGGPNMGNLSLPVYGPVPGGARNCIRCRWFVTEPHHLPALAAHFNTIAYHFDEARNFCISHEKSLDALRLEKMKAEDSGIIFSRMPDFRKAERLWESAMSKFSVLAEDLVACYRLIERCQDAAKRLGTGGTQIVAAGTLADVQIAFEETESELRQISGMCENAEIYPDLDPGKAVFRRSQLLDAALYREDLPPIFMSLSEQEQLLQGNAFLRKLGCQLHPDDPVLGTREVIRLMDAGERLTERLGIDVGAIFQEPRARYGAIAHEG